jgi:hypothetical protein
MVFTAQSRSHIVCSKETQRWWSGTWEKLSWKQKMKNGSILAVPRRANRISLGTCEKAAENSAFGTCFRHPFHHTPTHASGRFNLFLGSGAPSASTAETVVHVFDIHRGTYFGSTSSVPKMDSSPSTLRIMARGIYRTVSRTGLRHRLPIHRRPLSLGVYSLFSRIHASSHERTTIATPPCPFSSTLDRTRVP